MGKMHGRKKQSFEMNLNLNSVSIKRSMLHPLLIISMLALSCNSDKGRDEVEGILQISMAIGNMTSSGHIKGIGHNTLVTKDGTQYELRFMPDYTYTDNTGKNPVSAEEKMIFILSGSGGKYRCRGSRRSIDEVRKEVKESGQAGSFMYSAGTDYFFDVHEIELIQAADK